jgi:hypothetical protein
MKVIKQEVLDKIADSDLKARLGVILEREFPPGEEEVELKEVVKMLERIASELKAGRDAKMDQRFRQAEQSFAQELEQITEVLGILKRELGSEDEEGRELKLS